MLLRTAACSAWLLYVHAAATSFCFSQEVPSPTQLAVAGVDVPSVGWVPFRTPALYADATIPGTQQIDSLTVLSNLAGRYGWERFSSDSSSAPVIIELEEQKSPTGERAGYLAYSAFIAYAPLDLLRDRNLMEATFGPEAESELADRVSFEKLSAETLDATRDTALENGSEQPTSTVFMRLPLFNRVVIRGVVRLHQSDSEDSMQLCWLLDPAFTRVGAAHGSSHTDSPHTDFPHTDSPQTDSPQTDSSQTNLTPSVSVPDPSTSEHERGGRDGDDKLHNTWVKLLPNDVGRPVPSDPTPYQGLGGYTSVKATGLAKDQLLVETCMIIHEPLEWFSGSKFLRARLLVSMQEGAKSFRRKLSKLSK